MLDEVRSLASTVAESEAEDYESEELLPKRRRIIADIEADTKSWRSPVRLISAPDLPESENRDCVNLSDIIGHEDVEKLYSFNMMHDLQFLRDALHWNAPILSKRGSLMIVEGVKGASQMQVNMMPDGHLFHVIGVKLPHWGTHHSKLLVIFRKNGTICQFAITTANLIEIDWRVLTNAVYISPELCMSSTSCAFQEDFVRYIAAYDLPELRDLADTLTKYDFSEVRGTLVASVPGKYAPNTALWGAERLSDVLGRLCTDYDEEDIAWAQVSSLGRFTADYMDWFFKLLSTRAHSPTTPFARRGLKYRLVWPSELNIQESLQGYKSGGSIHFDGNGKVGSAQKNLLRSVLAQWKGVESGRDRIAPHIKASAKCDHLTFLLMLAQTFGRVSKDHTRLSWFLLTSANLSRPAWGVWEGQGTVSCGFRIKSYELGMLFAPSHFGDNAQLVPTFRSDDPPNNLSNTKSIVPVRTPFDLPFFPYSKSDKMWSPLEPHPTPDWMGNIG